MSPRLLIENCGARSGDDATVSACPHTAKSLLRNAFSIRPQAERADDRSLSALSYCTKSRRTQVVTNESFQTAFGADSASNSDLQLTNFNISVEWRIGIPRIQRLVAGGRHG
jgi:hypothetical protein